MFHKAKQSPWWRLITLSWARWAESDGDQHAAAFAYYLLLSLLPLTLLLVTVGSLFVEREVATQALVKLVNHYTPLTSEQEGGAVASIHGMLEARGKINLVVLPVLLWGSLKFLRTLIRTTNRIWRSPTYNWWRLPLKSLTLLGITVSALLIGILVPWVARLLRGWITAELQFPQWAFTLLFQLIPWLVLLYGLIMIYKLAPSRNTRFSDVWLGALGATALIWLGERLFLVYMANFAQLNALYGTLGGGVAFLLWLYLSSCVGVLGICFCAAQADQRANPADRPENLPAR
ncbi:MAG: YihY/virulence factor BrkB family protein [Opitutales bacterium]|nr:YihY/virulence factor BrkB family protein [Opitutales bacterium]